MAESDFIGTVTAPLLILRDPDGVDQYLYEGASIPSWAKDRVEQLESEGSVVRAKGDDAKGDEPKQAARKQV